MLSKPCARPDETAIGLRGAGIGRHSRPSEQGVLISNSRLVPLDLNFAVPKRLENGSSAHVEAAVRNKKELRESYLKMPPDALFDPKDGAQYRHGCRRIGESSTVLGRRGAVSWLRSQVSRTMPIDDAQAGIL